MDSDPTTAESDSIHRRRKFIVIIISTVIVIVTLTAWLIRPQIPLLRLDSASISHFTIDNSSLLSFTSQIHLTVINPNKKTTLFYDHIHAGVFYKRIVPLSEAKVPPFEQEREGGSGLMVGFVSARRSVEKEAVDGIVEDKKKSREVEFSLRIDCNVAFEGNAWWTRSLWVDCPLIVAFQGANGEEGNLSDGAKLCRVVASF